MIKLFSEDKISKQLDTKTVGNSGVTYKVLEYNTPSGRFMQLRIELKEGSGGVTLESGTLLTAENSVKLGKSDKIMMPGGRANIPEELQGYFKPKLEGKGVILLAPTRKYLTILPIEKRTGLIIEKGSLLACDTQFNSGYEDGGFEVVTSWNKNLRSGVESYRDITTTAIRGRGAIVLELEEPLHSLSQYDINSPIRINEDAVVMRTSGIERRNLSEEDKLYFNDYSGVEGKGVMYGGEGRMWLYPGNALPSKTNNEEIIRSFQPKKVVEEDEEEVRKKRGISILDKRR